MSEWKEYKLEDVTKRVKVGYVGSCEYAYCELSDNAVPMIRTTNLSDIGLDYSNIKYVTREFHEKNRKSQLHYGDILIARHGENGKASRYTSRNEANCLNVVVIEPDESLVPSLFIKYLFDSPYVKEQIRSSVVGSVQNVVNTKTIANLNVRIPAQDTVQNIVSILSSLDDKIAVNKKICENLETQAQALFKHWFVDFAPFKDGKFVESELGLIPEGWRVGSLGEYVDNLGGYSYKGSELQPSTTAMATIKNFVRGGGFKIEGYKEIIISKNIKDHQYINLFDVLVAHTDLTQNAEVVGNPAIILSTAGYEKLIMSMDLTKVVPKDKRLTAPLIHSILSTSKFKEHALGYVNGTTVLHMSKKAVPEYKLAMPNNLDVIKELSSLLDDLYSAMSETYAENLRLSTLRDTLLPKLMSGQIKV